MPRYLIPADAHRPAAVGDVVALDPAEGKHLVSVRRARPGDELELTDGMGRLYTGRLLDEARSPRVEILTAREDAVETRPPLLALAVGIIKGKRFEWALEKACELGVHRIVPVISAHSVVMPRHGKQERWQGILAAALKQCGRSRLPELTGPMPFAEALAAAEYQGGRVLFGRAPAEEMVRDSGAPQEGPEPWAEGIPPTLTAFIGPEGGWSAPELAALRRCGGQALDLGPHVLRTETAAAAALVILQNLRRNWMDSGAP